MSPTTHNSMPHAGTKRKPQLQHIESESDEDIDESDDELSSKKTSNKTSASQQLVPVPGNPDAPLVTKRTLQNRKAQREFRKRREARVRELEERCRRFDQMGLESNADLQRLAQQLKEENEALKSHVAGLGFAHTLPAVLDSVAAGKPMPAHSYPQLDMSMDAWARGQDVPATRAQHPKAMPPAPPKKDASSKSSRNSEESAPPITTLSTQPVFADLLPRPGNNSSVNPSMLNDSHNRTNTTSKPLENSQFDNDWFAQLAQSGHEKDEDDTDAQQQSNDNSAAYNPILSLNFSNKQNKNGNKSAGNDNLSGSAMLGAKQSDFSTGYPSGPYGSNMLMPMPTQQNGALLNPNPIPFAFNLSDPKNPSDQTWWSQMTNNLAGDDDTLDEKAQAVAQATGAASNNGAPSPFDLSAFLNGGMTPGGMFNFGSQSMGEAANDSGDKQGEEGGKASGSAARPLTQAEHAQMFLRLIEAKMAQRGSSPYAQLGFQPPMHQQQQSRYSPGSGSGSSSESSSKSRSSDDDDAATSLSPINVYSRLSQHPAFLSTNASELEELVDSIGGTKHQSRRTSTPRNSSLYPGSTPTFPSSPAAPNKALEVDETAVSKMLGLLDRKAPRESATTVSF